MHHPTPQLFQIHLLCRPHTCESDSHSFAAQGAVPKAPHIQKILPGATGQVHARSSPKKGVASRIASLLFLYFVTLDLTNPSLIYALCHDSQKQVKTKLLRNTLNPFSILQLTGSIDLYPTFRKNFKIKYENLQ